MSKIGNEARALQYEDQGEPQSYPKDLPEEAVYGEPHDFNPDEEVGIVDFAMADLNGAINALINHPDKAKAYLDDIQDERDKLVTLIATLKGTK